MEEGQTARRHRLGVSGLLVGAGLARQPQKRSRFLLGSLSKWAGKMDAVTEGDDSGRGRN